MGLHMHEGLVWIRTRPPMHMYTNACSLAQTVRCGSVRGCTVTPCMLNTQAHDMDHPGVNNDFLIKSEDPISLLYNDHSVLENSHCAALFFMMRTRPETNIFKNLTKEEFSYSRKLIMECILSTDMAAHFTQIAEIQRKLVPMQTGSHVSLAVPVQSTVETDPISRQFLIGRLLIKAADLSHIQQPFNQAGQWDHRIHEEFFEQGCSKTLLIPSLPLFQNGAQKS